MNKQGRIDASYHEVHPFQPQFPSHIQSQYQQSQKAMESLDSVAGLWKTTLFYNQQNAFFTPMSNKVIMVPSSYDCDKNLLNFTLQ